jgi:hypothetical protein
MASVPVQHLRGAGTGGSVRMHIFFSRPGHNKTGKQPN